jgi:soluble lytic murein transglycosylase-like protein
LLARLLNKESNYDRKKVSPRGARGIAQLMPDAVKDLGFDSNTFDYFNAEKSINAGAAFLAKYYGHFRDWPKTVAAYNWGIGNLHNWLQGDTRVGPDDETQTMLKHVYRGDPHAFNKKP